MVRLLVSGDIDHMLQEQIAIKNNVVKFSFSEADLAASQTATDIPVLGADALTYLLPHEGFIIGYAINKSAPHTAGSLDFDLELDGTSTLTIAADTASVYKSLDAVNEPFSAGQAIGVTYTSDGALDPLTVDVTIDVYVVFVGMEF